MVPGFVLCVAADAFGVPRGDVDRAACLPSVVAVEEWQSLQGELEPELLQVCWEAIRAKGCILDGGGDGVPNASQELGVSRVAQPGGELLDWCGVVVLLVSVRVWRLLGYPVGGLCRQGHQGQVLWVAVVCSVQSYLFELWSVACVLVFGMCVRASKAVCVAVGLLCDDVQNNMGVHASKGHPQSQRLRSEAIFRHPVEG